MTNFFFYNQFIYFNWRLITLKHCSGFCHTLTWINNGCTCVPHPECPSHLPPHPIPQGHHSAPAVSALSHALNLDWWSISHMVTYMFQCYSLKSSHTLTFNYYFFITKPTRCWIGQGFVIAERSQAVISIALLRKKRSNTPVYLYVTINLSK